MNVIRALESALGWLLYYPLLPLQMVLFYLLAWGRLGYEMGADDLFWSERVAEQILNGVGCGLLFGEILLVRYLLDPEKDKFSWVPVTLFPVDDPEVRDLGRFLALFWTASLLILWGFKLFSPDVWDGQVRVWPLLVGLAASVVAVSVGVALGVKLGLFAALRPDPLQGAAVVAAGLFAVTLAAVAVAHFAGAVLSPVLVVCALLGLANAAYGYLAFTKPGSQYIVGVALVVVALLFNSRWVYRDHAYKLTFPGLDEGYAQRQRIDEEAEPDGQGGWNRTDHYQELLKDQAAGRRPAPVLIAADEPLRKMKERWQAKHGEGSKPRVVLVCTSGGGIRAAVWTAVVLEGLEKDVPGLRDHLRMITGASGGMVGAGLYAAAFENGAVGGGARDPDTELGPLSGPLAKDSLRRTVQTMMLRDLPTLWWPRGVRWDRGREIEHVWAGHTAGLGGGEKFSGSPFRRPFAQLRDLEREGLRPSLVFSPMMVEDARRLLISNLDLLDLTWTSGSVAGFQSFRALSDVPSGPDQPLLSLSAVELFRLFPAAVDTFEVGTAARMNASFPLVSPAVSLPTEPPRRVVDAGYYDNFGVNLAAMWLLRHEKAIREHTSGVAVVEVRAYRNGYARWHFQDQEAEKYRPDPRRSGRQIARRDKGALQAALEWLSSPVEAISTARARAAYYRNDELLDLLDKRLNDGGPGFFTTVAFECEVDAALSWTLPTAEARRISRAYHGDPDSDDRRAKEAVWTRDRVRALKEWFGTGGR